MDTAVLVRRNADVFLEYFIEIGNGLETGTHRDVTDRNPAVGKQHQRLLNTVFIQKIVEALAAVLTEQARKIEGADSDGFRYFCLGNAFVAVCDNVAAGFLHFASGIAVNKFNILGSEKVFTGLCRDFNQDSLNIDPDKCFIEKFLIFCAVVGVKQAACNMIPKLRQRIVQETHGIQIVVVSADVVTFGDRAGSLF